MATKSMSTRIELIGEQEWRRAVSACKATISEFKTELDLINATYKDNATSLDALTRKQETQAKIIDEIRKAQSIYRTQIDKTAAALEEQREKTAGLATAVTDAEKKYNILKRVFGETADATKDAKAELERLSKEYQANYEHEKNLERDLGNLTAQYNRYEKQLVQVSGEQDKTNKQLKQMADLAKAVGVSTEDFDKFLKAMSALASEELSKNLTATYDTLAKTIKESIDASVKFEASMAKVQKTTNMTDDELKRFGDSLKVLSTNIPVTTTELAKISETAGQLGVATKDLASFVETMAMMGVSTNLSAEAAATALAQVASVTGMASADYEKLGSAIVDVGNNFATTETSVVNFTQRIAGAATNVSMSEADMIGLATAVTSLGIATDAGSTSMQSLINKMETAVATGDDLDEWAKVMHMSTAELTALWREDSAEAIRQLIIGLGGLDESMTTTLRTLGIGEQRIIRTVSTLANAEASTGLLTRALEEANRAWDEGTALQEEARKAYVTTESSITKYQNSVENLKIAVGDAFLPILQELASVGGAVNETVAVFVQNNPAVVAALGALTAAVGTLTALSKVNVDKMLGLLGTLKDAIVGSLTNPVIAGIAALAALAAAILVVSANTDTATKSTKNLVKASNEYRDSARTSINEINASNSALQSQIDMLDKLVAQEERSAGDVALINSTIKDLNNSVDGMNVKYDEATNTLISMSNGATVTTKNLRLLAQAQAEAQIKEEKIALLKQLYIDQAKYTEELAKKKMELNELLDKGSALTFSESNHVKDLQRSIRLLEGALDDTNDQIDVYYVGLETTARATTVVDSDTLELIQTLTAQRDAYLEVRAAATDSISTILDGFTKIKEKKNRSYQDLKEALDSEIQFVTHYADNIRNLTDRGIDGVDELIKKYSDGTVEGAQMIASFAALTDEQLEDLIEGLGTLQDKFDDFGDATAEAVTGVTEAIGKLQLEIDALNKKKVEVAVNYNINKGKDLPSVKNAQGLEYVPYDDYSALLHEGEMVLTRAEARAYREAHTHGQSVTNNNRNYGGVTLNVYAQQGQDVDKLADEIMYRIEDATKRKESTWA